MLIWRVGNKFIEFSIDYTRHGKIYNFKNPGRVINNFIENVARVVPPPNENDKFRFVCCIVNQSVVELHVRRLYTYSCFIDGSMNDRLKKFYFPTLRKGF